MTVTYLKVEFREKDIARSLGARWDAVNKQWFIPSGMDPAAFARWLPDSVVPIATEVSGLEAGRLSLSQLLAQIAQAVNRVTPMALWVKAEISECRATKNGHVHLDLVELDAHKNLLGKAAAKLFKTQADSLLAKFFEATQSPLAAGMKVLLQVKAQFHIQYGFSLIIEDIDPAYTLGDISAKLQHIRDTLKQEGLFERNKNLSRPEEFYRVAVLSPQSAAGLGDFRQEADLLAKHQLCHFVYYHAQFQGDVAANEITAALSAISHDHSQLAYDALVIIRGGGASIDLAWLNDLRIARAICLAPLPVFSGIGHERDNTILDEIAHRRFDTPSKVINHILTTTVHNAKQAHADIDRIYQRIVQITHQRLQHVDHHYTQICQQLSQYATLRMQALTHLHQRIIGAAQHHIAQQQQVVNTRYHQMGIIATQHLHHTRQVIQNALDSVYQLAPKECFLAAQHVDQLLAAIQSIPQVNMTQLKQQIDAYLHQITANIGFACVHYEQELKKLLLHSISLGPDATLKRGFILASSDSGEVISSRQAAAALTHFQLTFHDGTLFVHPEATT